jgi:hypothetical protein
LVTYIGNKIAAITDYSERWDHGEIISTAFAESTVDLVVSRRFAKKQQMGVNTAVRSGVGTDSSTARHKSMTTSL